MGPCGCILFDAKSSSSVEMGRSQNPPRSLGRAAEHPQSENHGALKSCKFSLLLTEHSLPSVQKPYRKQQKNVRGSQEVDCISYFQSCLFSLCLSTLRQVKIPVTPKSNSAEPLSAEHMAWAASKTETASTLSVCSLTPRLTGRQKWHWEKNPYTNRRNPWGTTGWWLASIG